MADRHPFTDELNGQGYRLRACETANAEPHVHNVNEGLAPGEHVEADLGVRHTVNVAIEQGAVAQWPNSISIELRKRGPRNSLRALTDAWRQR